MTGQCCAGEDRSHGLTRRLPGTAASILPGVLLVLLPKCPLCLAAWLSLAAGGIAISATSAEQIRWAIAVLWVATIALAGVQIIRRRAFQRRGVPFPGEK